MKTATLSLIAYFLMALAADYIGMPDVYFLTFFVTCNVWFGVRVVLDELEGKK